MNKILTLLVSLALFSQTLKAQGLENVIVETYYISEGNDTVANSTGGVLPVGSVTYRIYLDMLPGYTFQVAYGVAAHELRIETTTLFWNNEDRGSTSPNFSFNNAQKNTVMIDSWLTCGSACNGYFGIPKVNDNGVGNAVNQFTPQVLQNNSPSLGIPLTQQDGLIAGTPPAFSELGITNDISVFDNQNDGTNGPVFSTSNGSWFVLGGTSGPDTSNKVLIAQITTDGQLCFKLNVQLGTPTPGVSENYVWSNPQGNEILFSGLQWCSSGVGVAENTGEKGSDLWFSVYPNPSQDVFGMWVYASREPGRYSYQVSSIDGRVIEQRSLGELAFDQMQMIDLSQHEAGIYLVTLQANGRSATRKVIKH